MDSINNDPYEFNAPQTYCDLGQYVLKEPDDTYFDVPDGSILADLQTPQLSSERSLRSSSKSNFCTPLKPVGAARPVKSLITPKRTPIIGNVKAIPPREIDMEDKENEEQCVTPTSGGNKKKEKTPSVGTRCSPRLAEISKALRRSNAARRSVESDGTLGAGGANLSKVVKPKSKRKSMPKVSGKKGLGLSEQDMNTLQSIAVINNDPVKTKTSTKNAPAHLTATVPQEFNFTTGLRLRQKVTEPVEAPKKGPLRAVHHGPTRPQEFHFATDERIKNHPTATNEGTERPFPMSLRSGPSMEHKESTRKGPTIPQPFNLTESRKGQEGEANKFLSIAEMNLAFHTRTPQRFRSKRNGELDEPQGQQKRNKITIPHTPNFASKTRSRQVQHPSREEEEMRAFEEAQKQMFKARPVNKKVFEAPEMLNANRKKSTIPEPFNITKTKKEEKLLGSNLKEMCEVIGFSTTSISSLPWGGLPDTRASKRTNTELKPFSFDSRDKNKLQQKKEKILKVIEEEKKLAEFHAQPMPIFEEGIRGVPSKKPPTPTRAKPFNLRSDERGELKQLQINRKLEEEQRLEREQRTFHAQSDAVLHKQPFVPEKSNRPLTDISGFTLNTEVRAEERTKFEEYQKHREQELQAVKKEREAMLKAQEEEEVARLRKEAVHKANPVRNFKPVVIQPAPVPPTVPVSPDFATKARLRTRRGGGSTNSSMNTSQMSSTMSLASATFTSE